MRWTVCILVVYTCFAADSWKVRFEEPTGLYRRTNEVAAVPVARIGGHTSGYVVSDASGRELVSQVSGGELLFPVSLIPGELPEYHVACCAQAKGAFPNPIVLRKVGLQRVEFGNAEFLAVIDTGAAAIVEAYSRRAAPHRMLNLVETTPESSRALLGDIHQDTPQARGVIPPPVPGVDGENTGWTSLGGRGAFTGVEFVESGPLRGRLRLTRAGEVWEIVWTASSGAFRWKARQGFRLASVSAAPYVPFNRCVDGSEYAWPTGPGSGEPPSTAIAPRDWRKLPGGHAVYYQREEDYGALGIVALDPALDWTGACSRRLLASKAGGASEIAITFPRWNRDETVLEARREHRMLRQPVLIHSIEAAVAPPIREPVRRVGVPQVRMASATPFQPLVLPLDGEWELAWSEKGSGLPETGWRRVRVPGTVHTSWLDRSKIYTREAEWISGKEWWYRRSFTLPAGFDGKRIRLEFDATDYYADVYLNGAWVGRHEGYIDPYDFDVTGRVAAQNTLAVRVWTPVHYYWKHRPYTIKGAYGAVDQKPDDITALGITRSVRLAAGDARIADVGVDTRLLDGGRAEVVVSAEAPKGFSWEVTLAPRNFTGAGPVQVRSAVSPVTIAVDNAQLWWTRDHGKPNLYTLDVRLIDATGQAVDGRTLAVGIREIDKIGWDFYLNRKKLFIRGTNYYYNLYMSEMDRAAYERDIDLMAGMNINMIRLHCHFSNPEFYDLADEKGILIWQDFLEAWYPHDRGFAQQAAALYDNHIRYARNHASVALWATSDEEDFENYRDITKHLAPRAFFADPQRRPVVRSTGRFGDSHVYHGWYDGSIWDYTKMDAAFVSELGATSLPNYETIREFMGDFWPIKKHRAEWEWRRLQIAEAFRAWGSPDGLTLEQYIPRTQAYVARLFQIAIERMRRRKSEGAGGILHFHAIDIWPSVTMAAIDFKRRPTKVYDVVRRSFAPVAALFDYDRDRWKAGDTVRCGLWAVNDSWEATAGASLEWRIEGTGGVVDKGSLPLRLDADSSVRVGGVEWRAGAPGSYKLHAAIVGARKQPVSENIFEFEVIP